MIGLHHMLIHFPLAFWSVAAGLWLAAVRWPQTRTLLGIALAAGTLSGVAALASGLLAWPAEALLASPAARTKITLAVWAWLWWTMLWLLHRRHAPRLHGAANRWPAACLVLPGIVLLLATGAAGARLAGVDSPLPTSMGFSPDTTLRLPWWSAAALGAVVAALGALSLRLGRPVRR